MDSEAELCYLDYENCPFGGGSHEVTVYTNASSNPWSEQELTINSSLTATVVTNSSYEDFMNMISQQYSFTNSTNNNNSLDIEIVSLEAILYDKQEYVALLKENEKVA